MTERSIEHANFELERTYDRPLSEYLPLGPSPLPSSDGSSDPGNPTMNWTSGRGRETFRGGPPRAGLPLRGDLCGHRPRRAHCVLLHHGPRATRISVSLATITFQPRGVSTALAVAEYGVFLDGGDKVEFRREGVKSQMEALAELLDPQAG